MVRRKPDHLVKALAVTRTDEAGHLDPLGEAAEMLKLAIQIELLGRIEQL
jgi:hypothetical protein